MKGKPTTTEEFNKKYEKYLESGYYGLAINNRNVIEYLDHKFEKLIKKHPDFIYSQIKMKFNSCCFYADNIPMKTILKIQKHIQATLIYDRLTVGDVILFEYGESPKRIIAQICEKKSKNKLKIKILSDYYQENNRTWSKGDMDWIKVKNIKIIENQGYKNAQ